MQLWRYGQPIESLGGGRYILEGKIGSGGMAEVWKASDTVEVRAVAIKVLRPELSNDRETMGRFVKEAGQIVGWQHPHIVKMYDHLQIDHLGSGRFLFYLVMEYANGGDLHSRLIPGKPYSLRATFSVIMPQLCDAVAYAQKHGMVHRDIKPMNVLFRRPRMGPEEVVLGDFGLAVPMEASHHTFAEAGTLAYMAPEQFHGEAEPASDIFALGVILYRLCTGELPFRRSLHDLAFLNQEPPPSPPSSLNPALPGKLDQVILCALAPEPRDRYRSAEAFWRTIALVYRENVLPSEQKPSRLSQPFSQPFPGRTRKMPPNGSTRPGPTRTPQTTVIPQSKDSLPEMETAPARFSSRSTLHTPPFPSAQQTGKGYPKRMSRRVLIGTGATALAAIGGGALFFTHFRPSTPTLLKGTSPRSGNRQTPPTSPPSPTPTQAQSGPPISSSTPLYTYQGHKSMVDAVSWSPGGTQIASSDFGSGAAAPGTAQVWDATTGQHRVVYQLPGGNAILSATWSPNKASVAFCGGDNTVRIWTPATGHIDTFPTSSGQTPNGVAWSPDGARIAVGMSDGTIKVWKPSTGGNIFFLSGHRDQVQSVAWSPDGSKIASGSVDRTVRVWDANAVRHLFTYTGHTKTVESVSWSPDGTRIASGSDDGTVQAWNATTGLNVVVHHTSFGGVNTVAWSPQNARWIANNGYDSRSNHFLVELWDATTGQTAATYRGHTQQVSAIAWSPDGRLIASGSTDTTVQLWAAFQ